jgi:hypothetical protein
VEAAERAVELQSGRIVYGQPLESVGEPIDVGRSHKWCISYKRHCLGPKCRCCEPPMTILLPVKEPCGCCVVEVPVCVPACCTDAPKVHCRRGLFGRYIVTYDWCCGNHVKIVMTRHGDLIVHYFGQ